MRTSNIVQPSEHALFARVQRALRRDGFALRRCRLDSRDYWNLGRFFITDARKCVTAKDVDLTACAFDLGLLRPGERPPA